MKMYEVKEIEEYSGLNRKDLFVYEKSIPPVDRKDNAGFNAKGKKPLFYDRTQAIIVFALGIKDIRYCFHDR